MDYVLRTPGQTADVAMFALEIDCRLYCHTLFALNEFFGMYVVTDGTWCGTLVEFLERQA